MTIAEQLEDLNDIKLAIKDAIEDKGVTVGSAAYNTYAAKIADIPTGVVRPDQPANYTELSWTRPGDWLTLPSITAGDTRLVGLFAVYNVGTNSVAIKCTGAYTVDWGDGTTTNYATNVTAQHTYTFSSISSGTVTSEGFRQVIIQVYPQSGQTLTDITLNVRTNEQNGFTAHTSQWLDLHIASATLTSVRLGSSASPGSTTSDTRMHALRKLKLNCSALTNMAYLCFTMYGLRVAEITPATGVTSMSNMFNGCTSLISVTLGSGTFTSLTTTASMFIDCYSLRTVELFDTQNVTNMSYMFSGCGSLQTVPVFNTGNVTNMSRMFDACRGMVAAPAFNMVKVTDASYMFYLNSNMITVTLTPCTALIDATYMFYGCYSLQKAELLGTTPALLNVSRTFDTCRSLTEVNITSTSGVTNMNYMFINCYALQWGPTLNTGNVTQMLSMFDGCMNLLGIPAYDTSKVTRMDTMFNGCEKLITIPTLDIHLVTLMNSMFNGCYSLASVPVWSAPVCTTMDSMFNGCSSLATFEMTSSPVVTTCYAMFNGCVALKSAKMGTLTAVTTLQNTFASCRSLQYVEIVTGTALTMALGMFNGCYALETVPLFNTQNVTRMDNMFSSCFSLVTVPLFVTTNVTNMSFMFDSCRALRTLPAFDTAKVTTMDSMLNGCYSLTEIPAWNCTLVTTFSTFLTTGTSISRVQMTNIKFTISFSTQMMGPVELDELYTNLPTVTSKTLTCHYNWGYQFSNTEIPLGKGWTVTDPYYTSNVKLLCHFNGTNGQTTTTDNSPTPKTITRAGTITLSTAAPKFGTAATVSEASTANGWTLADSADWQFSTNAQFTIEAYVYYTTVPGGSDDACIVAQWGTNSQRSWFLGHLAGAFGFFYSTAGTDTVSVSAAWTPTVNTQYHIAVDRDSSNVIRVYINGVVHATVTAGSSLFNSTAVLQIGGGAGANSLVGMIGYIDELRICKSLGRYGGAFPALSAPFLNS